MYVPFDGVDQFGRFPVANLAKMAKSYDFSKNDHKQARILKRRFVETWFSDNTDNIDIQILFKKCKSIKLKTLDEN